MEIDAETPIPCQVSYDIEKCELIIKLVNVSADKQDVHFIFNGNC
ncbi:MAG TPA: hypothetical protein DCZ91_09320, partial [Lachnospiraceae bacterium]|nr:hypothetical protein [Lachnospiraceae bacterium]